MTKSNIIQNIVTFQKNLIMFDQFQELANELNALLTAMNNPSQEGSQEAVLRFNELKENEPTTLAAFCYLIEHNILRDQVMISLKNAIDQNWTKLDDSIKQINMEFLLSLVKTVPKGKSLSVLTNILCKILSLVNGEWDEFFAVLITDFSSDLDIFFTFLQELNSISLQNSNRESGRMMTMKIMGFLIENGEQITQMALAALQTQSWDLRINVMSLIPRLYANSEDPSIFQPHIELILSFLTESAKLSADQFSKLWTEFGEIAEIVEFEEPQKAEIATLAYTAASQYEGSAIELERPLFAMKPFFGAIGQEMIAQILELLFEIGKKLLVDESTIPSEVLSLYTLAAPYYNKSEYYEFIKSKMEISDFSDEEQLQSFIVGFSILNQVFETLVNEIRADFNTYVSIFGDCLQTENPLVIRCVCEMLVQLNEKFEKSIIENDLFLEILLPLIAEEDKEIHTIALQACYNLMTLIHNPIPGTFAKVFSISERVDPLILTQYMRLLAKSLELEGKVDQNTVQQLMQIIGQWLENEDISVVSGALTVSVVLISIDETCHEQLVSPIVTAVQAIIESEETEPIKAAIETLNFLVTSLKQQILPSIEGLIPLIATKATEDEDRTLRKLAAQTLVNIAVVSQNTELIERAVHVLTEPFESADSRAYEEITLENLPILCNNMPFELLLQVFTKICDFIKNLKNIEATSNSLYCLQSLLSKFHGDQDQIKALTDVAAQLVLEYSTNQWASQSASGIAGGDDDDIDTIGNICNLMCDFFHAPFDHIGQIFEYIMQLIQSEDEDIIDNAISVIGSAAESNAIPAELHGPFVEFATNLLTEETEEFLFQNTSFMLSSMLKSSILPPDYFAQHIPTLSMWYTKAGEENDIDAKVAIAYLFWVLVLDFHFQPFPSFLASFETYPPNEGSDLIQMSEVLVRALENTDIAQQFKGQILPAVLRCLALPSVLFTRYNIPNDLLHSLAMGIMSAYGEEQVTQSIQGIGNDVDIARINLFYQ